jgi:hypothetical protein
MKKDTANSVGEGVEWKNALNELNRTLTCLITGQIQNTARYVLSKKEGTE